MGSCKEIDSDFLGVIKDTLSYYELRKSACVVRFFS